MWFSSFLVLQSLVYQIPGQQRWFGKVRFIKARTPPLGSYPRQARARAPSSLGRSARQEIALLVSKNGCSRCQRSNYRRARRRPPPPQPTINVGPTSAQCNVTARRAARRGGAGECALDEVGRSFTFIGARARVKKWSVCRPRSSPAAIDANEHLRRVNGLRPKIRKAQYFKCFD